MAVAQSSTNSGALDTFPRLLLNHAATRGDRPATREKYLGIWQTWSWSQVAEEVRAIACGLAELGFKLTATRGTAVFLRAYGLDVEVLYKVNEGRPNVADEIVNRKIELIVNTPLGRESFFDDRTVRRVAMLNGVPAVTTLTGAAATVSAIAALRTEGLTVKSLQEYHGKV